MKYFGFLALFFLYAASCYSATEHFPSCEFTCIFPGKPDNKNSYIGDIVILQKQLFVTDYTILKAECMLYAPSSDEKIVSILKNQTKLSNIRNPTISIERKNGLVVGIYSGNKKSSEYNFKIHGKIIVGKTSTIHLTVIEDLEKFPSKYSVNFLDSIR